MGKVLLFTLNFLYSFRIERGYIKSVLGIFTFFYKLFVLEIDFLGISGVVFGSLSLYFKNELISIYIFSLSRENGNWGSLVSTLPNI